jgi:ABC-type branched-subunit amino acid transport system substrate-binding protein
MRTRTTRIIAVLVVTLAVLAGCSTSRSSSAKDSGSSSGGGGTPGRGVTASTIKVGFSYIDLETLAKQGLIKIDHGPYEDIIKALVDDVNAQGGINGRKLELATAKYSPIGTTDQLAACTKLTEDDQVFVVLNGFLGGNDLCVVQQHETALVGGDTTALTPAHLAAARAPWASGAAASERSIKALVQLLDQSGALKGKTIGVYGAQVGNQPLIDSGVKALKQAGYQVAETGFNDAPENDTQAAAGQDKVIAERMKNAGVNVVIDTTQFIPAANFDAADFHPSLYTLDTGNIAAAAFTNPFAKFPLVAGLSSGAQVGDEMKTKAFQDCAAAYKKATGRVIKDQLQEDLDSKSTGNVAMQIACTDLQIFTAGAKAAGKTLNNETFRKGVASLGSMTLANGAKAFFGPASLAGQVSFQLQTFDPGWQQGSGKPQFVATGPTVTVKG